jgi:3-isopropylmalate/(R)-2-methylmalate dehydratase small subunit
MLPFREVTAVACPLPLSNVNTDQLLPARFMKRSRAEGYGPVLLHDLRFTEDGAQKAEFPLNDPAYANAQILVARRNFGSGSSREAAVYALVDYGFRCVIAPSFGDIFASNAANNGLLAATVAESDAEELLSLLAGGVRSLTVDLAATTITADGKRIAFQLEPARRTKLLNGWDDIDFTLNHRAEIEAFAAQDQLRRPWAKPRLAAAKQTE